jgi:hypothetical protein
MNQNAADWFYSADDEAPSGTSIKASPSTSFTLKVSRKEAVEKSAYLVRNTH